MVNDIVLTIDFPEWIRQKSANDMFDLMQAFNIDLPAENERTLDHSFGITCELVATGYAFLKKVFHYTGCNSYVAAMRRYQPYQQLTEPQREGLDKRAKQIKK